MAGYFVTVLRAAVRVVRRVDNDPSNPVILEQTGAFNNDGSPVLRKATRIVNILKGDPIPPSSELADGEVERLLSIGSITGSEAEAKSPPAAKRPAAEGEPSAVVLDVARIGSYSDEDLVAGLSGKTPPGVKKLLGAVNDVAEPDERRSLAGRLLAAEKTALKGDARATLVEGLQKAAEGEPS